MEKRKAFENLPGEENPQFLTDGLEMYNILRGRYPKNTDQDLDNILNGLCTALIIMTRKHVAHDNHKYFLQLVYNILNKNLCPTPTAELEGQV